MVCAMHDSSLLRGRDREEIAAVRTERGLEKKFESAEKQFAAARKRLPNSVPQVAPRFASQNPRRRRLNPEKQTRRLFFVWIQDFGGQEIWPVRW